MVNYPHKISSQKRQAPLSQTKNFANRGMSFEKMINATNDYYLSHGIAVIHKKPTPVQIVRVDYPQRSRAKIVEPILDRPQPLTTRVFMKDSTLILKQKRPSKNKPCR